jgi:predicted DNA-binding transcriptional regulator AlpA
MMDNLNTVALRDLDRVATVAAWCARIGVSEATGRRLLATNQGPRLTRLSARRVGIRERDFLAWLEARAGHVAA